MLDKIFEKDTTDSELSIFMFNNLNFLALWL